MQHDVWRASSSSGKSIQIVSTATSEIGLLGKKDYPIHDFGKKKKQSEILDFFFFSEKFFQSNAKQNTMGGFKVPGPTLLILLT